MRLLALSALIVGASALSAGAQQDAPPTVTHVRNDSPPAVGRPAPPAPILLSVTIVPDPPAQGAGTPAATVQEGRPEANQPTSRP